MNKIFFTAILFGVASFTYANNEVSIFADESVDPQKVVQSNKNSINEIKDELSNYDETIDGMRSLVEGISQKNLKLTRELAELDSKVQILNDQNTSKQIDDLKKTIEKNKAEQDAKINKIMKSIEQLTALIDSKQNTQKTANKIDNNTTKANSKDSKKTATTATVNFNTADFSKKDPVVILEQADKDYKAKKYPQAKAAFEYLASINYRVAYSNYMLGEIEYFSKNYAKAIPYYKTTVASYNKGWYMPRLLYHTAISLDKVGQPSEANKFYSALKKAYPDSPEAKAAPQRK